MAKQTKSTEAQIDEKRRKKPNSEVINESVGEQANLAEVLGPMVATDGSVESQASRLSDPRLQGVQRQVLATQIGHVQGNQHLQKVLSLSNQGNTSSVQRRCASCQDDLDEKSSILMRSADTALLHPPSLTRVDDHQVVQRIGESLDEEETVTPAHGEDEGEQRRYSVDQYIAMWEAEQGRKLTKEEKKTLARGCIGITALNLTGGGNPPLDQCFSTFDQAKAEVDRINEFRDWLVSLPLIGMFFNNSNRAVLFAKMFWSNQDADPDKRKAPDPDAFQPNKSGNVDMSGYEYHGRPGFINFDYAFWDESSESFWHANHSEPGMEVYQSTKEKFAEGYEDFDRVIYCVATAKNYDPMKAAATH